ncbi:hypothetical protein AAF712_012991 [Marasmius tenuissimus]|uniref:Cytochrome P450 n=1 Tax=Marasmius tenuissimus TaxID=585030 RepID=A0ABR2ZFA3_9AGAR
MITNPEDAAQHGRRFVASLVFHMAYGGRLKDDSRDLEAVTQVLADFVQDAAPGKHIVDSFPGLDEILPDFLAPWRAEATAKHHYEMKLYKRLALQVKYQMDNDEIGIECFAARLWDEVRGKTDVDLEELAYLPGSAFEAGTDTSTGLMQWFVMAMLLYPETMRKAQSELDSVLGADGETMPGFVHFPRLPYCCALVKEVMRWASPAPTAFPHTSEHDDEYQGHFIPAKTMIIPCVWSMHHLEELYPDPMAFKPERFVDPTKPEVNVNDLMDGHYSFGFGRRKCPGMYLGAKSVWIGMVRMLWAFHFDYKLDDEGKRIPVSPDNCTSGLTTRPEDFPFMATPRSEDHKLTILKQFAITK